MNTSAQSRREEKRSLASALLCGIFVLELALATPAAYAGMGGMGAGGAGSATGAAGGGGGGGGGAGTSHPFNQTENYRALVPSDLTTCAPGQVWDRKRRRCLQRHSRVLPEPLSWS